jgi:hypothetical protein
MQCNCIAEINEGLKKQNAELSIAFVFNRSLDLAAEIYIPARKLDPKVKGKVPEKVFGVFCPFCGKRTQKRKAARQKAA